jgi:hypothetical protein
MIKKSVLLFLALLLPVSVFLFLHFFGKNEFDIPIYYQLRTAEIPTDCQMDYQFPYKVTNSRIPIQGTSVIFFTSGLSSETIKESNFQLSRILDEFQAGTPELIKVRQTSDTLALSLLNNAIALDTEDYEQAYRCVFLANNNRIVLIDDQRQIRGLFKDAKLKEVDRLILELKILFKAY